VARDEILTWANLVTALRTIICVGLFAAAAPCHSAALNLAGLGVYWILDIADGWLARLFHQETRLGAQFDILADRLLVAFFYMNHLAWHHELVLPIALFLVQFMLLDHYLSNQFLRWDLLSPNYFDRVDATLWRWNWSPPAKLSNTGLVTFLILVTGSVLWSTLAALALVSVKVWSLVRLFGLRAPERAMAR
jgi:CDP-diacylglycerol--glycerol-3-phosphate 3-phosphatidyltransferase